MSGLAVPFDSWCVDYHKTMAATLAVGNAVKRSASLFELVKDFWSVDRKFRSLLKDLNFRTEILKEHIPSLVVRLTELRNVVNKVIELSTSRGLANRTFFNGSIESIRVCNTRLDDFVERLRLSIDPSVELAVRQALAEYERGETVSLESVL